MTKNGVPFDQPTVTDEINYFLLAINVVVLTTRTENGQQSKRFFSRNQQRNE